MVRHGPDAEIRVVSNQGDCRRTELRRGGKGPKEKNERKTHRPECIALNGLTMRVMARGWESKSVEAQIDMAADRRAAAVQTTLNSEALEAQRKREGLLLSRTRVVRDLENAKNVRYRAVLTKALADLDAQIATMAVD
jgi:hypothetical protein